MDITPQKRNWGSLGWGLTYIVAITCVILAIVEVTR